MSIRKAVLRSISFLLKYAILEKLVTFIQIISVQYILINLEAGYCQFVGPGDKRIALDICYEI